MHDKGLQDFMLFSAAQLRLAVFVLEPDGMEGLLDHHVADGTLGYTSSAPACFRAAANGSRVVVAALFNTSLSTVQQ